MTTTFIVKLKDKQRRIYVDKEVWDYLGLKTGDYIEVDIKKLDKPKTMK